MVTEIKKIKNEIISIHKTWLINNDDFLEDLKFAEINEQQVREILTTYCESKNYEVNGFPNKHRELGITNYNYDCDYFTWERWELYLQTLAMEREDVFELYFFYNNLFWPYSAETKEQFKAQLPFDITNSDVDFEI